jgi:hypothetical protein
VGSAEIEDGLSEFSKMASLPASSRAPHLPSNLSVQLQSDAMRPILSTVTVNSANSPSPQRLVSSSP